MVSEIWNNVPKNIIVARAKIAQNAQCSRYLYLVKVHFLTSIIVRLLTNIAPIPNHNAMMKIFLLNAKAPITPSNEKLASKTSKYKNNDNHILWMLLIHHFDVCKSVLIHSMMTNVMIHRILATKNERCSAAGRKLPMIYTITMARTISMDLSAHIFCKYFSMYHNRWVSFSASRKKFNATNNKNVPPNHAIVICEAVRMLAYLFGSNSAKLNAAIGLIPPTIATMIRGKIILIPKTAIAIPRVKNLCCHFVSIFLSTVAFTTALSNDREISNAHNINTMNIVCNPLGILNDFPVHKKNARAIAIIVKIIDALKCFMLPNNRVKHYEYIIILFPLLILYLYWFENILGIFYY